MTKNKKFIPQELLVILIVIISSLIFSLIFLDQVSCFLFPGSENFRGEFIKLLISICGGIFIVYGLYISHLRTKAFQDSVMKQDSTLNNQTRQIQLSRQTQLNEQFNNAIEHLGSESIPIILGGVAELHRLAKENQTKYLNVVVEILSNYLRLESHKTLSNKSIKKNHAVLRSIGNHLIQDEIYSEEYLDLSFCDLFSVEFPENRDIKNINFMGSLMPPSMSNITFSGCNMSNVRFLGGTMENVSFENCKTSKLNFKLMNISSCKFQDLEEIMSINAFQTIFSDSIIYDFSESVIAQSSFYRCDLKGSLYSSNKFIACKIFDLNLKNSLTWLRSKFLNCEIESELGQLKLCVFRGIFKLRDQYQLLNLKNEKEFFLNRESDISGILNSKYGISQEKNTVELIESDINQIDDLSNSINILKKD